MIISGKEINGIFLAPMAGVTDSAFRTICIEQGAALTYTEMISAKGLYYKDIKTRELLHKTTSDEPLAVQIFGSDEAAMAYAAAYICEYNPVMIDINMGCPVPKVVKSKEGSALMKDIPKAFKIASCVVRASSVPVSVKFRSGFDSEHINCVEFARAMEEAGVSRITLHPRTREMFYSGKADWKYIKAVKEAVKIPVTGNGDVFRYEDVQRMKDETGCDNVMIGRGSLGYPWIFSGTEPDTDVKIKTFIRHLDMEIDIKGEERGVLEMRKHGAWYFKGVRNSARMRELIFKAGTRREIISYIQLMEG